jgi:two-component system sensor histidine kinase PilS (NtrC family)
MRTTVPALSAENKETLWRTLQAFNATRIVIVLALLAYLGINMREGFWKLDDFLYREICGLYLFLALGFAAMTAYYKSHYLLQVLVQIAVDLCVISMVYVAAGGSASGLAILYLFPLAGGAILAPMSLALFFTALVALTMLAVSGLRLLQSASESSISQAGLYGAAFFAAVYAINRLAQRLIWQEQLAAEQAQDLRIQQAINRLVIADMEDGVLVVGRNGILLTANPAAERMLGIPLADEQPRRQLDDIPLLMPIANAFSDWAERAAGTAAEPAFVVLKPGDEPVATDMPPEWMRREPMLHLKLRFATAQTSTPRHERTVIFLQDVGQIENQAQQLKLASMGRLTASIAHEVRNPLSAIAHAAALLGEEAIDPTQARMVRIVDDNVARLNRMIEDILKLSRKVQTQDGPVPLEPACAEIVEDFQDANTVRRGLIRLGRMGQHRVSFDPLHLREVIVNLLTNALRYASGKDGSIRLFLVDDGISRLELHVQDDGPPITPQVRSHLFEPFYTTSNKGTGLGLYLARELCLNNNAMLDYEYRLPAADDGVDRAGGRFVVTFAPSRFD